MRLYQISINRRYYETTNAVNAWLFAITFCADRMVSVPYNGEEIKDVTLIYEYVSPAPKMENLLWAK